MIAAWSPNNGLQGRVDPTGSLLRTLREIHPDGTLMVASNYKTDQGTIHTNDVVCYRDDGGALKVGECLVIFEAQGTSYAIVNAWDSTFEGVSVRAVSRSSPCIVPASSLETAVIHSRVNGDNEAVIGLLPIRLRS